MGRFESALLLPSELNHRAHLVIALVYVRRYGTTAVRPFRLVFRRYLRARAGSTDGYHETMTVAWLRLVTAFALGVTELELPVAAARLCERYPDKHALGAYYSPGCLMSAAARAAWVEPDLAALPGPPLMLAGQGRG